VTVGLRLSWDLSEASRRRTGRFAALAVLVATAAAIAALYAACPGCIERSRVNTTCEWTGDAVLRIDSRNAAHHAHLVGDAQLAEELAIRYADGEFKRLYGYEGHGGAVENGRVRNECMARLVAAIERRHEVTPADIEVARGERNRLFDSAAALLFVPFYVFAAAVFSRLLRRRLASDAAAAQFAANALAAPVAAAAGLQIGQLWLSVWEIVRVGNGHISAFRAATRTAWLHAYGGRAFAAALVLFVAVAVLISRKAQVDGRGDVASAAPAGILIP
jgi:hypothetical protein